MKDKLWLSSPHMGEKEQQYVNEAFETNWIAPLGPHVNNFEKDIEQYVGESVHVAALSAGTAALHLALILLDVKRDDIVLCQSMTFSASANTDRTRVVSGKSVSVRVDLAGSRDIQKKSN